MRRRCKSGFQRSAIVVIAVASAAVSAGAAQGPGTRSGEFLTIYADARPSSLSGAYTAIAEGPSAIEINPAGLARSDHGEVSASYISWYEKTNFQHLAMSNPVGISGFALGASFTYFNAGDFERTNKFGLPTGENLVATDMVGSFAAAKRVGRIGTIGAAYKFIERRLWYYRTHAYALDLGILYHPFDFPLEIGFTMQNLGGRFKFIEAKESLPFTLRGGISYPLFLERLKVSADFISVRDEDLRLAGGIEWKPFDQMSVRGGLNTEEGLGRGFTMGLGFRFTRISVDYAYLPQNLFADSHRLSLAWRFGGPSKPEVIEIPERAFPGKPAVFEERREPERKWKVTGAETEVEE